MKHPILFLRTATLVEAISFILLLGVAMPLKYWAGWPMAVRVVGIIHGILFIVVCIALLRVMIVARWPFRRGVMVFLAALLPFGPFILDRRMKQYAAEFEQRRLS